MAPPYITSNYTLEGLIVTPINTTACIANVQHTADNYQMLFNIGAVIPLLLWPLLPSTFEEGNFQLLLGTAVWHLLFLCLWKLALWIDQLVNGSSYCHWSIQFWVIPLLWCYIPAAIYGKDVVMLGRTASERERLERFKDAAIFAFPVLPYGMFRLGYYYQSHVREHSQSIPDLLALLTLVAIVSYLIYEPFVELATTAYYRFTMRRIGACYWLPENGAQEDFEPGWSRALLVVLCLNIVLAVFVFGGLFQMLGQCKS